MVPEHLKRALLNGKSSAPQEDILIKGGRGKDFGHLVKKEIINVKGNKQTVYINPDKETPKGRIKAQEEAPKSGSGKPSLPTPPKNGKQGVEKQKNPEQAKQAKLEARVAKIKEQYPSLTDDSIKLRMKHSIPMDATEVKVYDEDPKYVCEFRDNKGRLQKRYTQEYSDNATKTKFERLANIVSVAIPLVRKQVKDDLKEEGMSKNKVMATIVTLLDTCYFRIGDEKYAEQNGTYGVSTFRKNHLNIDGDNLEFSYIGKKSVDQHKVIANQQIADILSELQKAPGDKLFQYQDDTGNWKPVTNNDIRKYLGEWGLNPKDYRTYHATRLCAKNLAKLGYVDDEKLQKKRMKQAIEETAKFLGHTPEICRKSYINGAVLLAYQSGKSLKNWDETEKEGKTPKFTITDDAYIKTIKNGGVTISLSGESPTSGYAYAPAKDTETMVKLEEFNQSHIDSFILKYHKLLSQKGNHLGIWVDDGYAYLDISTVGEPSERTMKLAEKAGQLAVFDLDSYETIYTNLGGKKDG